ncbi:MAG: class I mannose-6-phosphate isomerase [Defluviitaleaceae bacterium]|nr:class I mannose-6-phosphate isomerase [Defluviitaleaceae bacterium]
MIKKIEAKEKTSVQVHPNDRYAFKYENGALGKSEVWIITKADENAGVYYGLKQSYEKEEILEHIENGTLENILKFYTVKAGDVFYIKAGVIHAMGAGIEFLEVQQNSNITYRMYDYNRVEADGKGRELHTKKALDVLFCHYVDEPTKQNLVDISDKTKSRIVCLEEEFIVKEYVTEEELEMYLDDAPFVIVNFLLGSGEIFFGGEWQKFNEGDAFCVSSKEISYKINPKEKSHIVVSKQNN